MNIQTFESPMYGVNCYFITDDSGMYGVVIDPAISYEEVAHSRTNMPKITHILLTHGHFDHMIALDSWRMATHAPLAIGAKDAPALTNPDISLYKRLARQNTVHAPADILLSEGDSIVFGEEKLTVLETPGHSMGGCCFLGNDAIFTGDTVFAYGNIGRADLYGSNLLTLYQSVKRVLSLKGDYTLYPGHGEASTLANEKRLASYL